MKSKAAAAMVTSYLGQGCSVDDITKEVFDQRAKGISNRALAAYLRGKGFECYNIHGRLNDLFDLLRSGVPFLRGARIVVKLRYCSFT